jgi:hypothetical protein
VSTARIIMYWKRSLRFWNWTKSLTRFSTEVDPSQSVGVWID